MVRRTFRFSCRVPRFLRVLPVVFLLLPGLAGGGEIGIPPGTDLAKLLDRPAVVASSITGETAANHSRWITMEADVHACTALPLDTLRMTARDFESYPKIFKRMKWDRVRRSPEGVFVEMFISVGLMGITYDTVYTLLADEQIDTPARYLLDFSHAADDGLVQSAHGIWYFESVVVNGTPAVYTRYIANGKVLKKYPLQDTIMSMFVNMEHIDLMNQFLRAVSKTQTASLSSP
jgi:hypothetical protein